MFFLGYLVLALIVAYSARNIAVKKGRSSSGWFWICFLIPVAVVLLITLDESEEKKIFEEQLRKQEIAREYRKCPYCAEYIKQEAKVCKHCGREVEPETETFLE